MPTIRGSSKQCPDRDPWIANVTLDPRFAPLRADDRYRHILGRLRL
jgi:hypothetical protein